jgi:hypothetical protein
MQGEQAVLEFVFNNPSFDRAGEFVEAATARGNRQLMELLPKHGGL